VRRRQAGAPSHEDQDMTILGPLDLDQYRASAVNIDDRASVSAHDEDHLEPKLVTINPGMMPQRTIRIPRVMD
jgi:hypothetical protein